MKKIARLLILSIILIGLAGCKFVDDIIDIIDPDIEEPIIDEELLDVSFNVYIDGNKVETKDIINVSNLQSPKGSNNNISVKENSEYRVVFILLDGKIITTNNSYDFVMDQDYNFDIYVTKKTNVNIVILDDEDNIIAIISKEKNSELTFEDTVEMINYLSILPEEDFVGWNQDLPEYITTDLFIKPKFINLEEDLNVVVELDKNYEIINDQEVMFKANFFYDDEELRVLEQGFIVLESNYFIDEITLNNLYAKVYLLNQDSFLETLEFTYSLDKLSELNVRAYIKIMTKTNKIVTFYSDYIHTPFIYANDLFFAGYSELAGQNKMVSIFNGTGKAINLDKYNIRIYQNGSKTVTNTISLQGILPHGKSYFVVSDIYGSNVIKERIINSEIFGLITNILNHNGNDALELVYENVVLDRIGTIGDDRTFGQNITVIRNKTITSGNITNWTIENPFIFTNDEWTEINFSLEYEQLLEHTVNNLGFDEDYNYRIRQDIIDNLYFVRYYLMNNIITFDLDFVNQYFNYPNVEFVWTSSKPGIFDHEGRYLHPQSSTIVDLSLQFYLNGELQNHHETFTIIVDQTKNNVILDDDFTSNNPQGWTKSAQDFNSINAGQFITSPIFTIAEPSRLIFITNNSYGSLQINYQRNDEIIYFETVKLNKLISNYVFTINNLDINNISFTVLDGKVNIDLVRLVYLEQEEDFEPPIIFTNINTKIPVGTNVNLDYCYAYDTKDGTLSCEVIENTLDISKAGTYKIIFKAIDSSSNISTLELIIIVYTPDSYQRLTEDPNEVLVKFIDIGKYYDRDGERGESIYIKIGEIDILVDAGMPNNNTHRALNDILLANLTGKLDYIIATHPDQDHIGGFPYILSNYEVGMAIIYSTTNQHKTQLERNFLTALDNEPGLEYCEIKDNINGNPDKDYCLNEYVLAPSVKLTFIDTGYLDSNLTNESSIVFVLEAFETRILLTGDAEEKQEKVYASKVGKVNIFKLGHHGTRNATSEFLLSHINPEVAIVTHGVMLGNGHGHPTFEAINRIYGFNSKIQIYTPAGGGSDQNSCQIVGPSYKCGIGDFTYQRNGTLTVTINKTKYIITSERYGTSPIEFSSLTFWKNHPNRRYSYTG